MATLTLRIHLFGEPRFEYDGEPWLLQAPPMTLPLLAYLLLHRRSAVPREKVAGSLWPEIEQSAAFANLRRHLHYLSKALPPSETPWLAVSPKFIGWNARSPYWLDVEAFERESTESESRALAVRRYAGDLYERCSEPWLEFERERLRTLQLSNLRNLCDVARSRSAYVEALQYAQLMLLVDPWREDAVRAIMEIRVLLGDRAGALNQYERFAQRLRDDLNTQPLEETTRAYQAAQSAVSFTETALEHGEDVVIVGRSDERATLLAEWQRAMRGEGRTAFITGEAGIGKSTLLQTLQRHALTNGGIVLGAAVSMHAEPFAPFAPIVRLALTKLSPDDPLPESRLRALARIVPELLPGSRAETDENERGQIFGAFAELLAAVSARTPVLIAIEDLQFAGEAALELLADAILRLTHSPILFVATYREFEIGRQNVLRAIRRHLSASRRITTVALNVLDREDAEALISERSRRSLDSSQIAHIYERSGGNPLFIVELLREIDRSTGEMLPASITQIVESRVERLDRSARSVLAAASVAGQACQLEVLAAVCGASESELLVAVDRLVETHFLRFDPLSNEVAFVHHVIREAIYTSMSGSARRTTHARTGMALRELFADRAAEIAAAVAWHFDRGHMRSEAAPAHLAAAEHALNLAAFEEAKTHAEAVVAVDCDASIHFRARCVLESVAAARGDIDAQKLHLNELRDLSAALSEKERGVALLRTVDCYAGRGLQQQREALDELEAFVARVPALRPEYELRLGEYFSRAGDLRASLAPLRIALANHFERGNVEAIVRAMSALYAARINLAEPVDDLEPDLLRAREKIGEAADTRLRARLAYLRAGMLLDRDPIAAYDAARACLDLATRTDDVTLLAIAWRVAAAAAIRRMMLQEAAEHLSEYEKVARTSGRAREMAQVRSWQVRCENRFGDFARALELGDDGIAWAELSGSRDLRASLESNLAVSARWIGDYTLANAFIRRSNGAGEHAGLPSPVTSLQGEIAVASGNAQEGLALIEESVRTRSPQSVVLDVSYVHEPVVLGLLYLAAGRTSDARECASRIVPQLARFQRYYFHPQAYLWSAAQLLRLLGYSEFAEFSQAARSRYDEILRDIRDERARKAFAAFPLNRLLVLGVEVDDPIAAWFAPDRATISA